MNKSRYVFFILACLFGLYVQAQNRTVKGRVLSAEDKEPLIGATVKIPGTSIGVVTDIDGNFSLEVPDWQPCFLAAALPAVCFRENPGCHMSCSCC